MENEKDLKSCLFFAFNNDILTTATECRIFITKLQKQKNNPMAANQWLIWWNTSFEQAGLLKYSTCCQGKEA